LRKHPTLVVGLSPWTLRESFFSFFFPPSLRVSPEGWVTGETRTPTFPFMGFFHFSRVDLFWVSSTASGRLNSSSWPAFFLASPFLGRLGAGTSWSFLLLPMLACRCSEMRNFNLFPQWPSSRGAPRPGRRCGQRPPVLRFAAVGVVSNLFFFGLASESRRIQLPITSPSCLGVREGFQTLRIFLSRTVFLPSPPRDSWSGSSIPTGRLPPFARAAF